MCWIEYLFFLITFFIAGCKYIDGTIIRSVLPSKNKGNSQICTDGSLYHKKAATVSTTSSQEIIDIVPIADDNTPAQELQTG